MNLLFFFRIKVEALVLIDLYNIKITCHLLWSPISEIIDTWDEINDVGKISNVVVVNYLSFCILTLIVVFVVSYKIFSECRIGGGAV